MSLRKKQKQLIAAAMAALMAVGTGVPAIIANAPVVFASGAPLYTDANGNDRVLAQLSFLH